MPNNAVTSQISAATKVFALPELLEHILLQTIQCDTPDVESHRQQIKPILRSMCVNRTFYHTITGSKACMRAIFLKHAFTGRGCESDLAHFNPLLLEVLEMQYATREVISGDCHLHYFVYVRDVRFTGLASELERMKMQGRSKAAWLQAQICNMPARMQVVLLVGPHKRTIGYSGQIYQVGTVGEAIELFVDEVKATINRILEKERESSRKTDDDFNRAKRINCRRHTWHVGLH